MSTVNQIIANAQLFAGVTSSQVPDATTLWFVNLAYHDIEEIIRNEINEDYFYDYFNTNTKLNQSEYNFSSIAPSSSAPWILKIISVWIKYSSADVDYKLMRPFGSGSLDNTPEYYSRNQSKWDPFYIYKDNSLFIYPYPDNNGDVTLIDGDTVITNGLRVHCSVSLIDLIAWGAESTVKIPRNHHKAIALKAATYIYMHRNLWGTALAQSADLKADAAIQMMKENLSDRSLQPMEQDLPNLTWIMY